MQGESDGLVVLHQEGRKLLIPLHERENIQCIDTGGECRGNECNQEQDCLPLHPCHCPNDGIKEECIGIENKEFPDEIERSVQPFGHRKQDFQKQEESHIPTNDNDIDPIE